MIKSQRSFILGKKKEYINYRQNSHAERDRTRTCNPQIRSLVPYPLGHTPFLKLLLFFYYLIV